MNKYKIVVLKKARKFIDKQPVQQRDRIYLAIFDLPSGDVKLLQASNGLYRLRAGDYRIIFTVYRPCLIHGNVPNGAGFFRWASRFDPGILGGFQGKTV